MSCKPGNPCYNGGTVVYPKNCKPACDPIETTADKVTYYGPDLPCTDIESCDTLEEALQKIDDKLCCNNLALELLNCINTNVTLKNLFCQMVTSCIPTTTTTSTSSTTTTTSTTQIPATTTTTTSVQSGPTTTTSTTTEQPLTTTSTSSSTSTSSTTTSTSTSTTTSTTSSTTSTTSSTTSSTSSTSTSTSSTTTTTTTAFVFSDNYDLSITEPDICTSPVGLVLYSSAPFASGVTLYTDSLLTTPVTGYDYIKLGTDVIIFNISSTTGIVGVPTGTTC